jgi:hypothetical protein
LERRPFCFWSKEANCGVRSLKMNWVSSTDFN